MYNLKILEENFVPLENSDKSIQFLENIRSSNYSNEFI